MNTIKLNDKLKSLSLLKIILGLFIAFIASLIIDKALKGFSLNTSEFSVLLTFFLLFIFLLRGAGDFKDSVREIFSKEYKNEVLYLFILNLFFGFFVLALFGSLDSTFSQGLHLSSDTGLNLLLSVISTVILGPVVEEIIFRGIIFNKLNCRINVLYAVLITSLLFSAFHGFGRLLVTFIFSMCICILYLKTENILIPIFIHFLNNLVATILTDFAHIEPVVSSVPVSYLMLVISTVSGILMIKYIYDNSRFLKSKAS